MCVTSHKIPTRLLLPFPFAQKCKFNSILKHFLQESFIVVNPGAPEREAVSSLPRPECSVGGCVGGLLLGVELRSEDVDKLSEVSPLRPRSSGETGSRKRHNSPETPRKQLSSGGQDGCQTAHQDGEREAQQKHHPPRQRDQVHEAPGGQRCWALALGSVHLCRVWISHLPDHPEHQDGHVTTATRWSDHAPFKDSDQSHNRHSLSWISD